MERSIRGSNPVPLDTVSTLLNIFTHSLFSLFFLPPVFHKIQETKSVTKKKLLQVTTQQPRTWLAPSTGLCQELGTFERPAARRSVTVQEQFALLSATVSVL